MVEQQTVSQVVEVAGTMIAASATAAILGGLVGGFVYSLCSRVWDHVADRLADRRNEKLEEEVLTLRAQCWRLRTRSAKGGV